MLRNAILNFLAFLFKSIFVGLIFEGLVKGIGFLIIRLSTKKEIERDGPKVIMTGVLFWLVILGIYLLYPKFI